MPDAQTQPEIDPVDQDPEARRDQTVPAGSLDTAPDAQPTAEPAASPQEAEPPKEPPTVEVTPAPPAIPGTRPPAPRPTLRGAGVRTSGPAPPSSKKGRKQAEQDAAVAAEVDTDQEQEPFDPATDLPMYREGMDWFVLRVASNKENFVKETLLRKVQIEALEDRVGRIMVPTEKTKTLKGGKTRITETKLYPGYIFVEMRLEPDGRIPQDVFFLIKETTGVGDFVGTAGRPTPMGPHEVEKMLFDSRRPEETPSVKMEFNPGDYVIITEGPFESYEGTVDEVLPEKGLVRVLVTIFGRQAPIELEYWQIQKGDA